MRAFAFVAMAACLVGCMQESRSTALRPDDTGVNVRDRDGATVTPADQSQNQADINVTAQIRKDILAQEDLSVNARNVKVVTADGHVTLRGPVQSQGEKDRIGEIARQAAGGKEVKNLLEVNTP